MAALITINFNFGTYRMVDQKSVILEGPTRQKSTRKTYYKMGERYQKNDWSRLETIIIK